MRIWLTDKRAFEQECYLGLKYYGDNKKTIRRLILSLPKDSSLNIMACFDILCGRILSSEKWGSKMKIEYCGAVVNGQHFHFLVKMPRKHFNFLKWHWSDIIHVPSADIDIAFVQGDKSDIKEMHKLVTYIMNQGDEHDTDDVVFYKSLGWGSKPAGNPNAKMDNEKVKEGISELKEMKRRLFSDGAPDLTMEDIKKSQEQYKVRASEALGWLNRLKERKQNGTS